MFIQKSTILVPGEIHACSIQESNPYTLIYGLQLTLSTNPPKKKKNDPGPYPRVQDNFGHVKAKDADGINFATCVTK